MSNNSPEYYPSNIKSTLRIPGIQNTIPEIRCPADPSFQAIMFRNTELQVIKGIDVKSKLDLRECFVPCGSFVESEILIPPANDNTYHPDEMYHVEAEGFVTLDYGFLKNVQGKVSFVAIFPMYGETTITDQSLWKIDFRFQGETEYRTLGRVFIYSATDNNGIPPIEFKNNMGVDVYVKFLIGN